MAWIKGTESFCEYYDGNYSRAVELAHDGLDLAGNGPQRVRLLINGEARALGKLATRRACAPPSSRHLRALDQLPEVPGVCSCVSLVGAPRTHGQRCRHSRVDLGLPSGL